MRYIANWSVGNIGGNRGEAYGKNFIKEEMG